MSQSNQRQVSSRGAALGPVISAKSRSSRESHGSAISHSLQLLTPEEITQEVYLVFVIMMLI